MPRSGRSRNLGHRRSVYSGGVIPVSGTNFLRMDFETMTVNGPTTFTGSPKGDSAVNIWGSGTDIVPDPTGAGKGNVARFHYVTAAANTDSNLSLTPAPYGTLQRGLGQTMWFQGEFYIDSLLTGTVQRKLLYWEWSNDVWGFQHVFQNVITSFDNQLVISAVYHDTAGVSHAAFGPDITFSGTIWFGPSILTLKTWHTLKVQMQINSAFAVADGILRCWLDGVQFFECLDMQWTSADWTDDPATYQWVQWQVGQQMEYSGGGNDEYRYWNNISYADAETAL